MQQIRLVATWRVLQQQTAQAAATSTYATVATKALSLALKTIGIGLIISAVATLITYGKTSTNGLQTHPALKNLSTWFNKIKAALVLEAIGNYMIQLLQLL